MNLLLAIIMFVAANLVVYALIQLVENKIDRRNLKRMHNDFLDQYTKHHQVN